MREGSGTRDGRIGKTLLVLVLLVSCREQRAGPQTGGATVQPPIRTTENAPEPDVEAFVADFMERRIALSGAEKLLTEEAMGQFDANEGSLFLYGTPHPNGDPSATYTGYEIASVEAIDASSYEVVVRIRAEYLGDSDPVWLMETLFVGPGSTAESAGQALALRGAVRQPL